MALIGDQFSEKDAQILGEKLKEAFMALGSQVRQLGPDAVDHFLSKVDGLTITINFNKRA
ncbi:MAG: hypothetical protein IT163_06320 [Bryobacterales bacterium]|nr:hypothetical protein [Bryobacterales bacterium]